jgi:uncharacterized repeat protein (TIGR01451 family)
VSITDSTISGNAAPQGDGGGISEIGDGSYDVSQTTISDNSASSGGGAIDANAGTGTISFSTINANTSDAGTGNLNSSNDGTYTLDDSIVAEGVGTDGSPSNCSVPSGPVAITEFTSAGNNLFDDTADSGAQCGAVASDVVAADVGLDPLADNTGPAKTEALKSGSPAVNGGNETLCDAETDDVDERGVSRPQEIACDIGAFEPGGVDLVLGAVASAPAITDGDQDTVTETITNLGPTTATNATLTAPSTQPTEGDGARGARAAEPRVSGGFGYGSATPSQGSCSTTTTTVTCSLGNIGPGAHVTVTIIVTGTSAGTITIDSGVVENQTDPTPANNYAVTSILVNPAGTTTTPTGTTTTPTGTTPTGTTPTGTTPPPAAGSEADLVLRRSVTPDQVTADGTARYTLRVNNDGPDAAVAATVTDHLPAGERVVGKDPAGCHGHQVLHCALGTIADHGSRTISFRVRITGSGRIVNKASVTSQTADPDLRNNASSAALRVAAPLSCTRADVFLDTRDPAGKVKLVEIYVDGLLRKTLTRGDLRRITVAPPHGKKTYTILVRFFSTDERRPRCPAVTAAAAPGPRPCARRRRTRLASVPEPRLSPSRRAAGGNGSVFSRSAGGGRRRAGRPRCRRSARRSSAAA